MARFERRGDRRLIDDPATRHVDDDRAPTKLGDLALADEVARGPVQRDVHGDDIGARKEHRHVHELDAVVRGLLRRDVRIGADHDHLHRPCSIGDRLADLAEADDPERTAAQLEASESITRPLATAKARIRGSGLARHAVEQRERVLRGGDRVAGRGVDDGDPRPRRCVEIDVVDTDTRPPDDDQPRARGDHVGIDLDLAADDQRLVLGDDRKELLPRAARALVDFVASGKELQPLARHLLGDEDPHAVVPATARAAIPWLASAARWAAATAAPGSSGRPPSSETISSVLIAPRISSRVTEPR